MDKRQFLKTTGALLTGTVLARLNATGQETEPRTNWSGNYTYQAENVHLPRSVEEVQQIVKGCSHVKALGARHSFDNIADTPGDQISVKHLTEMKVDPKSRTVTVGGGVKYGQLAPYLDAQGFALHNLASLPHISIAGACATATHGSGSTNGNLSTAVAGMEIVTASGEVATLSRERDGERFNGAVVSMGALGVATKLTLEIQPTYQVRQVVYENLPMEQLENHLEEIFASGYSVSLFTDWQNHRMTQVWIKSRVKPGITEPIPSEFFGAKIASRKLHPLAGHSAENCTEQLGIPGPWYERLPHFRMNFTPSSGAELQTEYFVPREKGYQAVLAVEKLREHVTPHLFITELRTVAADHLWTSMSYQRPAMTIHFTWKPEWPAVRELLPVIEKQLAPFDARPHWAKLFTVPPARLHALYARMPDYQELLKHYDPNGKFRNEFLNTNIFG